MTKIMEAYHKSVLTKEVLKGLKIYPSGVYVDATYGGGGHSREILKIFLSALWPLEIIITANIEIKRIIFQFFEELSLTKKSMFKKDFKFFIFFERF